MSLNPRPTRSEQRDAARAKARELREQRAKGDQRKRLLITAGSILGSLAVIAGVAMVLITASGDSQTNMENAKKVPANVTALGGVIVGKDLKVISEKEAKKINHVVIYQDYQCPICELFEGPNLSQIKTWAQSGLAAVEFHPISFLDSNSLNNYSSRAANAAFCVANSQPDKYFDVNSALYYNQPQEGTAGPDNNALKETLKSVGVEINDEMNKCIDQKRYGTYINNITNTALSQNAVTGDSKVTGTPHILVNGVQYTWENAGTDLPNPGRFAQFFNVNAKK